MAENVTKYNLRPSTELKVVKEPCLTCRYGTEEETLFPDRVAIVPETSESNEVDHPGCIPIKLEGDPLTLRIAF